MERLFVPDLHLFTFDVYEERRKNEKDGGKLNRHRKAGVVEHLYALTSRSYTVIVYHDLHP